MKRLVIVDDQDLIRAGLRVIVSAHPDLEVVAEASDGLAAVAVVEAEQPDVVLMDLRMPGIDGVEAIRRIRTGIPAERVRILVLTTFEGDDNVLRALRAGADGFLGKGAGPAEITDAILAVAAGGRSLSSSAVGAVVDQLVTRRAVDVDPAVAARFDALTTREREVVAAIVTGLDNAEIAAAMFLSPFTVKTHANRAMAKVGARDRAQLVTLAFRAGITPT